MYKLKISGGQKIHIGKWILHRMDDYATWFVVNTPDKATAFSSLEYAEDAKRAVESYFRHIDMVVDLIELQLNN